MIGRKLEVFFLRQRKYNLLTFNTLFELNVEAHLRNIIYSLLNIFFLTVFPIILHFNRIISPLSLIANYFFRSYKNISPA